MLQTSVQHAYGQIPLTPKYDKVIESKAYPGVKISYKAVSYSNNFPLDVDVKTDNFMIGLAWNLRNYPWSQILQWLYFNTPWKSGELPDQLVLLVF